MSGNSHVSCGRDVNWSNDLNQNIEETMKSGFDFVCLPVVNGRLKREFFLAPSKDRSGPLTRSDLLLNSHDWGTLVVAKMSPWLQLDSPNEIIRKNSERALKQELMFSSHLSVPAVMISLKGMECTNMARCINEHILQGHSGHIFWVHVPMKAAKEQCDDVIDDFEPVPDWEDDTWHWWNKLRTLCDSNKKLGLVLEVTADLPSDDVINRWVGEPVKAAMISTSLFLTNKKGFPVLSKAHQALLKQLFMLEVQLVLTGKNRHEEKGLRAYQLYLDHLYQQRDPPDNIAQFARGYEDYLQCPLQPLMDNLESQTYEVFERDPIKYSNYEHAVYLALRDRVPEDKRSEHISTLMVLGAGRGPLVTAALKAADKSGCRVRVYAVEKNPNAVVTLENLKREVWGDLVTIVSGDMRFWEAPEKADIIISELLGSFGDNELSPECLDGAQRFLKADSISIPCSYTSYLAPLQSSKLWNEARLCRDQGKPVDAQFETPYVVRLHNSKLLDEPKPLFTFQHPNNTDTDVIPDNSRYGSLEFDIALDTILHGFGGYFYCILYGNVTLSIVPDTHTPGMFSWFPIYFPIKEPLHLHQGDKVTAHFWRLTNQKNVWYEWCTTSPVARPIHNPKGRSYTIGL